MKSLMVVSKELTDKQAAAIAGAARMDEGSLELAFTLVTVDQASSTQLVRSRCLLEAASIVVCGKKAAHALGLDLEFRRWYAVRFGERVGVVVPVVVVASPSTRVSRDNAVRLFEAAKLSMGGELVRTAFGLGVRVGSVTHVDGAPSSFRRKASAIAEVTARVLRGETVQLD